MPPRKFGRRLMIAAVVAGLTGPALAQDIDQGKPAPKLFADTCAACHRSARGLAKGRFSLTLYLYLQKHYASNSTSAWALTSYLESVDAPKPPRAAARPSGVTTGRAGSAPRPPIPVPTR
jgi:mono/diheme cytochrome c family protein